MEVFLGLQWCFELLGELIDEPKPSVVAGVLVFSAWVAQANKQFDHAGIIYPSLHGAVIARSRATKQPPVIAIAALSREEQSDVAGSNHGG